jgi:cytohesin
MSDVRNQTKIYKAIMDGDCRMTEDLLTKESSVDVRLLLQRTALHVAAERGNDEIVRRMLDLGANHSLMDYRNDTPLHLAAGAGAVRIVESLLASGAIASAKNTFKESPLHALCSGGGAASAEDRKIILSMLLDVGCGIDDQDSTGRTPLWMAAGAYSDKDVEAVTAAKVEVVKMLLSKGARRDIAARGRLGTALDASRRGGVEWGGVADLLK